MRLLLGIGGIDVSVGSVLGLAAIGIGRLLEAGAPPALSALAGPVAGLALGMVTAVVVIFGRIPAIVATLGLLGVYRAGIFLALGGSWLSGLPVGLTNLLSARILGVPISVLVIALAYGAVFVAVRLTPFGAHLLAIGNSEARARLAGIGVRKVQVAAFVISGGLCGLAASFDVATYRNRAVALAARGDGPPAVDTSAQSASRIQSTRIGCLRRYGSAWQTATRCARRRSISGPAIRLSPINRTNASRFVILWIARRRSHWRFTAGACRSRHNHEAVSPDDL